MENSHAMQLSQGSRSRKQEEVAFVRLQSRTLHGCTYASLLCCTHAHTVQGECSSISYLILYPVKWLLFPCFMKKQNER